MDTPEQAEAAFYQAFQGADLAAMMAVWADEDGITCVHPMGERLSGRHAIASSWRDIFSGERRMKIELKQRQRTHSGDLAVHVVEEHISLPGDIKSRPPMIATNVYLRSGDAWHMILHHASPSVIQTDQPTPAPSTSVH